MGLGDQIPPVYYYLKERKVGEEAGAGGRGGFSLEVLQGCMGSRLWASQAQDEEGLGM